MEQQASKLYESLMSLSEQLAAAISARDADRAARGIRKDEHVVHVSDGAVIRGCEYREPNPESRKRRGITHRSRKPTSGVSRTLVIAANATARPGTST